jgi:hypothetical protein
MTTLGFQLEENCSGSEGEERLCWIHLYSKAHIGNKLHYLASESLFNAGLPRHCQIVLARNPQNVSELGHFCFRQRTRHSKLLQTQLQLEILLPRVTFGRGNNSQNLSTHGVSSSSWATTLQVGLPPMPQRKSGSEFDHFHCRPRTRNFDFELLQARLQLDALLPRVPYGGNSVEDLLPTGPFKSLGCGAPQVERFNNTVMEIRCPKGLGLFLPLHQSSSANVIRTSSLSMALVPVATSRGPKMEAMRAIPSAVTPTWRYLAGSKYLVIRQDHQTYPGHGGTILGRSVTEVNLYNVIDNNKHPRLFLPDYSSFLYKLGSGSLILIG